LVAKLLTAFSLKQADDAWRKTVADSLIVGSVTCLWQALCKICHIPKLGSALQALSFYLVLVLLAALPAPAFVNDKEGLAFISLAALSLWLLGRLLGGKEERAANAIDIWVVAYACLNLISTASSHYLHESIKGMAKVFVYLGSFYLFTAQLGFAPRRKIAVAGALTLSAFVVGLYGLYQYKIGVAPLATWEDPNLESKAVRIYATFNNPNLLAGYLIPILPLTASLAIAACALRKWLLAALPACATLTIGLAIILTGSRGGYLGFFAEILFLCGIFGSYLWQEFPRQRPFICFSVLAVGIVLGVSFHHIPFLEQRFTSIFAGREHSSNSFRLNVWTSSLAMFKDNWWFGIGVGNEAFRLAYGLYMRSGFDALGTYCVPLEIAVELGVVGLLIFAGLLLSALSRGHLNFISVSDVWQKCLTAGAAAALIGLTVHGLVDTVFYRPQVHLLFWMIMAFLIAPDGQSKKINATSTGEGLKIDAGTVS
jgi:putative inorganic carbon (HCO3(-)) transporter